VDGVDTDCDYSYVQSSSSVVSLATAYCSISMTRESISFPSAFRINQLRRWPPPACGHQSRGCTDCDQDTPTLASDFRIWRDQLSDQNRKGHKARHAANDAQGKCPAIRNETGNGDKRWKYGDYSKHCGLP
jgi:hypothetical protein